jgi:hypothetical protein
VTWRWRYGCLASLPDIGHGWVPSPFMGNGDTTRAEEASARGLDWDNLPDTFTVEHLAGLTIGELKRLEEADLTQQQRDSLKSATTKMLRPLTEAVGRWTSLPKLTHSSLLKPLFTPGTDVIGERLSESLRKQSESTSRLSAAVTTGIVAAQEREAQRWTRLNELSAAIAESTAALVARTEQQHREAERQKGLTLLLAFAVIVAAVHPLVQSYWVNVLQTLGFAVPVSVGVLWWTYWRRREHAG